MIHDFAPVQLHLQIDRLVRLRSAVAWLQGYEKGAGANLPAHVDAQIRVFTEWVANQ